MFKSSIVWSLVGILLIHEACASRLRNHPNWPTHLENICGDNNDDRISGGRTAELGQFPWMAQIIVNVTLQSGKANEIENSRVFFFKLAVNIFLHGATKKHININCGGTLITEQHVVSAAHCAEPYKPVAVVLGEWDTRHDPDCSEDYCADTIKTIPIERYFFPREYVEGNYKRHDILLIKLLWPVVFTEWITPICLPTGSEEFPNFGEVAGWGHTKNRGQKSKKLKYVKLQFAPMQACQDAVGLPFDARIQFCAGSSTKDDACVGDSGGPWMQVASTDNGPRYYLTGVVSMGPKTCGAGIGVYTRITAHMKYILDRLN